MNQLLKSFITITMLLLIGIPSAVANDIVAVDTIQFVATRIQSEPDPKNEEYVFAFWGEALGEEWKVQIDYHAAEMYGTFSDEDFGLASGGGSYNYLRKAQNDMWMRSFKHLDVSVSDVAGDTHIVLNGLIQDYGQWRRVLVDAVLEPPAPTDTIALDLGVVMQIPNSFLGYTLLEARNEQYSLTFGLSGTDELKADTFYMTELVRPDFVKLPADTIAPLWAQLVVCEGLDEGCYQLCLDLLSEDEILYKLHMHTDTVEVSDTVKVECVSTEILDYRQSYGIVQIYGESPDYNVSLSVTPGVIDQELTIIPVDSINLAYTMLARRSDFSPIRVHDASAWIELDETQLQAQAIHADLVGTDGTLYRVMFPLSNSGLPAAADTTEVACGVGRVDYSLDPGWVGFVLANDDADVHIVLNNEMSLSGRFGTECFDYSKSYVTTYHNNDEVIRFADIELAEMQLDSVGNDLEISLNAITVGNHLYHFTAMLTSKRALTGDHVAYAVGQETEAMLVALREAVDESHKADYHMQLQRADAWGEYGEAVGNGETWDFRFSQEAVDGIGGSYGYAAGTLDDASTHYLLEDGTEIWLKPLAGTLNLEPLQEITLEVEEGMNYKTHLYRISAEFVASNNIIYELQGENVLLCVDAETGEWLEFSEQDWASLPMLLESQGWKVRKVLHRGLLLIERASDVYTLDGKQVK